MEDSESAFKFMFTCSYARLHNAIHITFTEAEAKLEPWMKRMLTDYD